MIDEVGLDATLGNLDPCVAKSIRTYVSEAVFFFDLLWADLSRLPRSATVMDVGSGIGLLALMMRAVGFSVVAVEPESSGFSDMYQFRQIILSHWEGPVDNIVWVDQRIEDVTDHDVPLCDFAVALNVVEHVPRFGEFTAAVLARLAPGGVFRFVCPNYSFPYEPHFNMLTLGGKSLTFKIRKDRIRSSTMSDPLDLWKDLSWPTVSGLRRQLEENAYSFAFTKQATKHYLVRARVDEGFKMRKRGGIGTVVTSAAIIGERLASILPVEALPIVDCRIVKT